MRFFDWRDCVAAYGADAELIARRFYRTTAVLRHVGGAGGPGGGGLAAVTLNRNLFETALRELLVAAGEHTVELYEGHGGAWALARAASPGKLQAFEEELFRSNEMPEAPAVAAAVLRVVEGQRRVGVAFTDNVSRLLRACEFADDEHFCAFEALLVQTGARECVLPFAGVERTSAEKKMLDVLADCNVLVTERKRAEFSAEHLEQDVQRLVKGGSAEHHRDVLERPAAAAALAGLLAFAQTMADTDSYGKWRLELYDPGRFMRLDAAALRALNVLKLKTDGNNNFSVYGLLAKGRTPMSKRLVKAWVKQPLVDVDAIDARLDIVEALVEDPILRGALRDNHFRGLPDVERLARKLERRKATLMDLCMLYRASGRLPLIEDSLRGHPGRHAARLLAQYAEPLKAAHGPEQLTKFEELMEAAMDLDKIPDEYLICPSYSDDLRELTEQKDKAEAEVEAIAAQIAADLGLVLETGADKGKGGKQGLAKLEWHRVNNTRTRCMRITQKEEKKVRKTLQARYLVLETRKDGTKFTNRAMKAAAETLNELIAAYNTAQRELVQSVVDVAASFVEVFERVAGLLGELDALAGFAEVAANAPAPYVRPTMLPKDGGKVVLQGCRHPCVEAQDGVDFIPNDCELVEGRSWFQIITGPNMGGKSTYIRQVGVTALMAQVGSFVACDRAEIAVRDAIFARVGAGDSQLRGVSTFMAEMLETASILKGATAHSLIIVDELGRGTSTYDGLGLAWAISEHLMNIIRAPALFATHFHELTAIEGPGVANRHVETALDPASGKLTMLYQVQDGPCDQSFGIHVAEHAHFPAKVVELAKAKAAELEAWGGLEGEGAEVGHKRKRVTVLDDKTRAEVRAKAFLQEFAALPMDQLSAAEADRRAMELKAALLKDAESNPHLQQLIQGGASKA